MQKVRELAICGGEKNKWQKKSKCKGPGAEACQKGFRNGKQTSVERSTINKGMGNFYERRKVIKSQISLDIIGCYKNVGFCCV